MLGPMCIVTGTTKICEATSYEGKLRGRKISAAAAKKRIPRSFEGRVIALMHLAHVTDAPFCIVHKSRVARPKRRK